MGGHPTFAPVGQGQLLQAFEPKGATVAAELTAGLGAGLFVGPFIAAQGLDQILLVVPVGSCASRRSRDPEQPCTSPMTQWRALRLTVVISPTLAGALTICQPLLRIPSQRLKTG
jgi:hypothetical protein